MASTGDAEADGDQRLHEQVQDAVEHRGARGRPETGLEDHARVVAVVRQGIRTFPVTVFERASGGLCGNQISGVARDRVGSMAWRFTKVRA